MAYAPAQGFSAFSVNSSAFPLLAPNGTAEAPSYSFSGATNYGLTYASSTLYLDIGGALRHQFDDASYYLTSDSAVIYLGASSDVRLYRDAAAVLALKNGTTAQEFRVYGTTTGPKYASLSHNATIAILDSSPNTDGIRTGSTGGKVGFYGTAPIALQTGVAVSAAGVHAALVALGLITA